MSCKFEPLTPHSHLGAAIQWQTPFDDLADAEDGKDEETLELGGIAEIPRDALARILDWLVGEPSINTAKRWRVAQLKLAAVAHMLNIQNLRALSLQELGDQLKTTRANLSLYQLSVVDKMGLDKAANGKQRATRESYREAALASHRARNHRMSEDVKPSLD